MPKRPQAKTQRGKKPRKKGYKLQISRGQASLRSKKGWITRRQHGFMAKGRQRPRFAAGFDENEGLRPATEFVEEMHAAGLKPTRASGNMSIVDANDLIRMRQQGTLQEHIDSPEFKESLASLPAKQRGQLLARLQKAGLADELLRGEVEDAYLDDGITGDHYQHVRQKAARWINHPPEEIVGHTLGGRKYPPVSSHGIFTHPESVRRHAKTGKRRVTENVPDEREEAARSLERRAKTYREKARRAQSPVHKKLYEDHAAELEKKYGNLPPRRKRAPDPEIEQMGEVGQHGTIRMWIGSGNNRRMKSLSKKEAIAYVRRDLLGPGGKSREGNQAPDEVVAKAQIAAQKIVDTYYHKNPEDRRLAILGAQDAVQHFAQASAQQHERAELTKRRAQFAESVSQDRKGEVQELIGKGKVHEQFATDPDDDTLGPLLKVEQKRLDINKVGDLYDKYGHERTTVPREMAAWLKHQGLRAVGRKPEGDPPVPGTVLKNQFNFNKEVTKNRLRAIKSGDADMAFGGFGQRVAPHKARFGFTPNKEWEYTLNIHDRPGQTRKKRVAYNDTTTKFHEGKRKKVVQEREIRTLRRDQRTGEILGVDVRRERIMGKDGKPETYEKLMAGEWDQVQAENLVRRFQGTGGSELGDRIHPLHERDSKNLISPRMRAKYGDKRPDWADSEEVVPLYNIDTPSTRINRGAGGRRYKDPRTGQVYDSATLTTYVPASQMRPAQGARDRYYVRVPKVGPMGERLGYIALDESDPRLAGAMRAAYRPAQVYKQLKSERYSRMAATHPDARPWGAGARLTTEERTAQIQAELRGTPAPNIPGAGFLPTKKNGWTEPEAKLYSQYRDQILDKGYQDLSYAVERKHGSDLTPEQHESHVKEMASAAAAAMFFSTQRRAYRVHAPNAFNKVVAPRLRKAMGETRWQDWNMTDKLISIEEGAIRPLSEKIANLKFMARHPLSSPEGTTMGLEWGSLYNRTKFIPESAKQRRALRLERLKLERIGRTKDYLDKHAYSRNPLRRLAVGRKDNVLRLAEYKNFDSNLDEAMKKAARVAKDGVRMDGKKATAKEIKEANKLLSSVENLMRRRAASQPVARVLDGTGQVVKEGAHIPHIGNLHPAVIEQKSFLRSKGMKYAAGGAAATGAVLGAGYLLHRLHQRNKDDSEKVAFYNRILPPAFNAPVPTVGVTKKIYTPDNAFTREVMIANKGIPVGFGADIKKKRIALRPSDHGFDKNAPLGLKGLRVTAPKRTRSGGTANAMKNSLVFDVANDMDRKRMYRKGTHSIHGRGGKKLPVYLDIGRKRDVQDILSSTNPRKMSTEDRERIVRTFSRSTAPGIWAEGRDEHRVKAFYSYGMGDQKVVDMMNDPKKVRDIRRKNTSAKNRKFMDAVDEAKGRKVRPWTGVEPDVLGFPTIESPGQAVRERKAARAKAKTKKGYKSIGTV